MKTQMRMIVTDDGPVHDVKLALAKEKHDRTVVINALFQAGHVQVMADDDPINIRIRIEDEFFAEPRDVFPTTNLIARVQLALQAGLSERNRPRIENYHAADAMSYAYGKSFHEELSKKWARSVGEEFGKVTAAVTKTPSRTGVWANAKKALRKGLRP